MRYQIAVVIIAPLLLAGCPTKDNPKFCNATDHQCDPKSATPFCDVAKSECVSQPPDMGVSMDMATDAGVTDMAGVDEGLDMPAGSDGGGADANMDLKPMCTTFADCTNAALPICGAGGVCRTCTSSADDTQCAAHASGKDHCNTTTHACVECNGNPDCKVSTSPICESSACRGCGADSECASKVCNFGTGACADASTIGLVDHGGVSVATCEAARTGPGAQTGNDAAHAWCDIKTAIAMDTRAYLLVTGYGGGAKGYSPITTIGRNVTLVGPGGSVAAASRATVNGSVSNAAITIDLLQTVVLDGLEITGAASGHQGINCTNAGATLVVRNSNIHNNDGSGVNGTGCLISITGSTLSSNNGGAITTSGSASSTTISGSTISGNTGGGVSTSGTSSSTTITGTTISGNTNGGVTTSGTSSSTTITGTTISGNTNGGVTTGGTGSSTTISSTTISGNTGGQGIVVSSGSYNIFNNFLFQNAVTIDAAAVELGSTATGQFYFNTVADNGKNAKAGGISCNGQAIEASIVWGNTKNTNTQFRGTCDFFSVVTDTAETLTVTGLVKATPAFVNAGSDDFSLDVSSPGNVTTNKLSVLDQIMSTVDGGVMTLPTTDFFGNHRPQNNGWDIGAHEALYTP